METELIAYLLLAHGNPAHLQRLIARLRKERKALKELRRYIYFGIAVLSAAITPGDTITEPSC